jgi:hypothetical protein
MWWDGLDYSNFKDEKVVAAANVVQVAAEGKDLYAVLGVAPDATAKELRTAYRKLAIKYHPDKGGDPEKMKELNLAYELLQDENLREYYNFLKGFPEPRVESAQPEPQPQLEPKTEQTPTEDVVYLQGIVKIYLKDTNYIPSKEEGVKIQAALERARAHQSELAPALRGWLNRKDRAPLLDNLVKAAQTQKPAEKTKQTLAADDVRYLQGIVKIYLKNTHYIPSKAEGMKIQAALERARAHQSELAPALRDWLNRKDRAPLLDKLVKAAQTQTPVAK